MKKISYELHRLYDIGTEEEPNIVERVMQKSIPYSEAKLELAKAEAYNGEYVIEDDDVEEITTPTQLDMIEAQVTYTAMMTDTLLEV